MCVYVYMYVYLNMYRKEEKDNTFLITRRAKNLRDILVRARLPRTAPTRDTRDSSKVPTKTTNKCNKAHCQYCSLLNRSGRITSIVTQKEYNTRSKVTCRSNNIIYCLCCTVCGNQYVGQTKRPLVDRLREHQPKY